MTIINAVTGAGSDPQLVSIDNAVTEFPQTFSPPTGYDGLSSVTVQAPANFKPSNIKKDVEIAGVTGTYETEFNKQSKSTKATAFPTVLEPDTGYDGLSKATVTAPDNLTAGNIKKGVAIAEVVGTYDPQPNLQTKTAKPTAFPMVIEPDADYDGLSKATVNPPDSLEAENIKKDVEIAGVTGTYEPTLYELTVVEGGYRWGTGAPMIFEPSEGVDGYKKITLRKPDNLIGGVIKKDITIAGITGTYDPQPTLQTKETQAVAFPTVVDVDSGYDGMTKVTVTSPDNLEAGNIKKDVEIAGITGTYEPPLSEIKVTPTEFPTVVTDESEYYYGMKQVTVTAPVNLTSDNIKKGVEIAGITGIYDPQPTLQTKTTQATSFPTVVDVDEGYDGMTEVTVTAPDNLEAGNIKKGVEIAGVAGTYEPNIVVGSTKATSFPTVLSVEGKGWDGYSEVTVYAPDNLTPKNIKKGVSIAEVVGTYEPSLQTKETKATAFPTVVDVDSGYDGMSEVTVTAPDNLAPKNIKKGITIAGITGTYEVVLQRKEVQATSFPALYVPDSGQGFSSFEITAPDNLEAGNIKKGVTIAKVEGTYEPNLQTTYAVPTAFPTTYTPTTGFDGIASIEIRIPKNLEAGNIKKDVTIAGITGTYEGAGGGNTMGLYLTNKPFELTEDNWSGVTGTVTRALSSTNVTSVVIGEGITTLAGYMFSGCKSLTTVQLPSTLTALPDGCFQNSTVTSVNIPSGIANISTSCFYNCSNLTEIDIPATVSILYSYAFNNCTGLKTITVRTQTPPTVQSLALTGLSSLTTIYVPSGRGNVYKAASGWASYSAKIVEGDF